MSSTISVDRKSRNRKYESENENGLFNEQADIPTSSVETIPQPQFEIDGTFRRDLGGALLKFLGAGGTQVDRDGQG